MLADFLDALASPTRKASWMICPRRGRRQLRAAVDTCWPIPPEVVAVYLQAFNEMNEADWRT